MGEITEKIALFFYFAFLDEVRAREASRAVLKKIRLKFPEGTLQDPDVATAVISLCDQHVEVFQRYVKPSGLSFSAGQIILPQGSNWGPWFEFRRMADQKDFHAVIWTRVLGFAEDILARALRISLGTVRYRVGRGLKTLGRICQDGGAHA